MEIFPSGKFGRVVSVHLKRGDLLLESICAALEHEGIKNAVLLSAIGSLQKVEFHRVITKDVIPQDEFLTITTPCEISSAQGLILNGAPHIHFVFSDVENTYTGHLEPGTEVLYLVEMVLAELPDCNIVRKKGADNVAYFESVPE